MANATATYDGKAVQLKAIENGFQELVFNLKDESANKFGAQALGELGEAVDRLAATSGVRGLLITSAKDAFILGADVTEFLGHFEKTEEELESWMWKTQQLFSRIDDLPFPTLAMINGFALGGGFEVALAAHFRVVAANAKVGLPETKLGIFPGWGGTVRLSRLIGADNAIEWIASGNHYAAGDALKMGCVDAVADPAKLREVSMRMLDAAASGKLDWKARHAQKQNPLHLGQVESAMTFEGSKAFVGGMAGPNYPAPLAAIVAMEKGARLSRDAALKEETKAFAKIAKTPVAAALVGVFLGDQYVKKVGKKQAAQARPVKSAAVLGAGIMGGGIAYQSSTSKVPVVMKDIKEAQLELGMREASKLLEKQVERGKLKPAGMAESLSRIRPTLSMTEIKDTDIVVEAVVELEKVKAQVLAEVEAAVRPDTIVASNTSTISINRLAKNLKRPENFCGMHFFNPVHRMPLVEVIRGEKSSEQAIATTVAYALAMGKTPIVVNDCPGFLVNRVLFPYLGGFMLLMRDGVGFERVDKVMEKFGWPMGPAYLLDVVGIDTGTHAQAVMAEGFPDRMKQDYRSVVQVQYEAGRFGQKNGKGFYNYTQDPKGKPVKAVDPAVHELLKPVMQGDGTNVSDEDIVHRMMLPMIFESSRCLEEKIVASPTEVDISLLYGLGFPPFRGGVLKYADSLGANRLVELGEKFAKLGGMYTPTAQIRAMVSSGKGFYQ